MTQTKLVRSLLNKQLLHVELAGHQCQQIRLASRTDTTRHNPSNTPVSIPPNTQARLSPAAPRLTLDSLPMSCLLNFAVPSMRLALDGCMLLQRILLLRSPGDSRKTRTAWQRSSSSTRSCPLDLV
eukprot:GHUV01042874.1.p1 GENE.GHUV01042874.1~~GHUV01042874.1.p1  ORF type:complete len:126 (+),score=25.80 GHUV01042874.1:532-909(+)